MMRSIALLSLLSSSLLTAGCDLYFPGDDDDDCDYGGAADREPGFEEYLRNPESGQCEWFGGGYPPCDGTCGPCLDSAENDALEAPLPTWAVCSLYCEALDEMTCWATSGCRAAYVDEGGSNSFWECWGTDQTGPIQGGGCDALDAYACSLHDDCVAVHSLVLCDGGAEADQAVPEPCGGLGWFEYCADEPVGCYGDAECGEGQRCNAGEVCLPPPGCEDSGNGLIDCDSACYGYCVPDEVPDPGTCYGEVLCDILTPPCPTGTTPGIRDGCYTGYCIPLSECEDPPVACSAITDENTCVDRADCAPFYEGIDCVCDEFGTCECADWLFVSCR